jgi:hypothetical protein
MKGMVANQRATTGIRHQLARHFGLIFGKDGLSAKIAKLWIQLA